MIMMTTPIANGAVPSTLQRSLSHCSRNPNAVISANVIAIIMRPWTVRMPDAYHCSISADRKKD